MAEFLVLCILFYGGSRLYSYIKYTLPAREATKKAVELQQKRVLYMEKKDQGKRIEDIISELAQKKLPDCIVIKNAIINRLDREGNVVFNDGAMVCEEIGVIILSKKGILVVNPKKWNGNSVRGELNEIQWKVLHDKQTEYSVYSPLKEVTDAVTCLKRHLPDYNFNRCVVFPESTDLSFELNSSEHVFKLEDFKWYLGYLNGKKDVLTPNAVKIAKDKIVAENEKTRAMHLELEKAVMGNAEQ